jgi:hypothetical protein
MYSVEQKGHLMNNVLNSIRKGMDVYDFDENKIGTVEYVQFGDEDPNDPSAQTETVSPAQIDSRDSIIDNIADAFRSDDLPEELRERLLRHGFIRVDAAGLFSADRYILADQIQSVSEDRVTVSVDKEEAIRRS